MSSSPLSARAFFRDPVGYVRSRGDGAGMTRLAAGSRPYAVVRDPDEIWRVLVSDAASYRQGKWKRRVQRFVGRTLNTLDGEEHRQRRGLLNPILSRSRVAGFAPAIVERVERRQAGWSDGDRFVLRDQLDPLCLTIAGDVLISADLEEESGSLAETMTVLVNSMSRLMPPLAWNRRGRALAQVTRELDAVIADRRQQGDGGDDLLGVLLEAGLPEQTVRGELLVFLLAALDEPPSGLEAAYYFLGHSPDSESRMFEELDRQIGDRPPVLADVAKLPYLDAVIREALRLLPPARHLDRCPVHPVEIDGGSVSTRSNVIISPLVTHRDPSLYDRPSEFDPQRWLGGAKRAQGEYLPFGAGSHACIGAILARTIMALTLATTGRRWRLRLEPDSQELPEPGAPRLQVKLERR